MLRINRQTRPRTPPTIRQFESRSQNFSRPKETKSPEPSPSPKSKTESGSSQNSPDSETARTSAVSTFMKKATAPHRMQPPQAAISIPKISLTEHPTATSATSEISETSKSKPTEPPEKSSSTRCSHSKDPIRFSIKPSSSTNRKMTSNHSRQEMPAAESPAA